MSVEVVKPGLLTTLQDAGRAGYAHLGVGRSGAFDAPALRIANALAGNPATACGLELTLLGPTLRFSSATSLALTGAPTAFHVDGTRQPMWAPVAIAAGATATFGAMTSGCRSYLAVRGGFNVAAVLGSRSEDVNARLGPLARPLRAGDILPVSEAALPMLGPAHTVSSWRVDPRPWFADDPRTLLRLLPGAQLDTLASSSRTALFSGPFTVQRDSNRTGVRLAGPALERTSCGEMISEGCVPGLLQLPPSGRPIAFGPECPVSGGYPRIGQIAAIDIPRLAQLRPGDTLRFTPARLDEASRRLHAREQALQQLESSIRQRLSG